jgi:hypothetical protein
MAEKTQPPPYSETHAPNHPGVFPNLKGFIRPRGTNPKNALSPAEYSPVITANPNVGDVIHILEENHATTGPHASSLHQRVMLVIRDDKAVKGVGRALTCVPLCDHSSAGSDPSQSHWNVGQELNDGTKVQTADSPALWVQLRRSNHFLLEGITVNLAEIWHVGYEGIIVRDLGRVPPKNLNKALARVVKLFRESILPPAEPVAEKKEPDSAPRKNIEKEAARKK